MKTVGNGVRRGPLAMSAAVLFALLSAAPAGAQEVKGSAVQSATGERMVRVETVLRQPPEQVWKWLSTVQGLQCWAAPVVQLDWRIGGSIATSYKAGVAPGGPGSITLGILNYVDNEVLTLKVKLNENFSQRLRAEDGHLQEVIQLQRLPDGGTRIVSSMLGWGKGEEWDKAFNFFIRGNEWSYKELAKCGSATR